MPFHPVTIMSTDEQNYYAKPKIVKDILTMMHRKSIPVGQYCTAEDDRKCRFLLELGCKCYCALSYDVVMNTRTEIKFDKKICSEPVAFKGFEENYLYSE
jgi:hypothetical protein